ncbi:hypothetical protein GCM10023080_011010 [Streptomyces pseudoechinosporeus]
MRSPVQEWPQGPTHPGERILHACSFGTAHRALRPLRHVPARFTAPATLATDTARERTRASESAPASGAAGDIAGVLDAVETVREKLVSVVPALLGGLSPGLPIPDLSLEQPS